MYVTHNLFKLAHVCKESVMANYRGHVAGGCIAYIVLLSFFNHYCSSGFVAVEWFLCTFAGSLFPDIDTKSRGQKYFYWLVLSVLVALIISGRLDLIAIASILIVLPMLVRHRGIFHNFWFIVLMPTAVWFFVGSLIPAISDKLFFDVAFFVGGAISHLWLDFYFVPTMRFFGLCSRKGGGYVRR